MDQKKKYVIAIGIFDGVHLGHQAILKKAIQEAKRMGATPAALTFPSHPSRVLRPHRPAPLLQSFEQRCEAIRRQGIKRIFSLHFTKRLSKFSPSDFVDQVLFRHWNARGVVVGRDFCFGHRRCGTVKDLERLLKTRGAKVWGVDAVRVGGRVVQSTVIRRYLAGGNFVKAVQMLGHKVELTGVAERGHGLGRQLGARTVNVKLQNELLPRFGVYAGWLKKLDGGIRRPVVVNIGVAPTAHRRRGVLLEAHVMDGRNVSVRSGGRLNVELIKFLRPERKFSSLEALRRAIQKDVRRAKQIVGTNSRRIERQQKNRRWIHTS